MPKNYTCFWRNENDFNEDRPWFIIERIPKWKYLATLYIILLINEPDVIAKIDEVVYEYLKLERERKDCVIAFNYERASLFF